MDHCLSVKVLHGASFPIRTLIIVMMIMVFIADQLLVLSTFFHGCGYQDFDVLTSVFSFALCDSESFKVIIM